MSDGEGQERTLEALSAAREAAESDVEARLAELARRLRALIARAKADDASGRARSRLPTLEEPEKFREPPAEITPRETAASDRTPESATAGARERLAAWLLQEHLAVRRRRATALRKAAQERIEALEELSRAVGEGLRRSACRQEELRECLAEETRVDGEAVGAGHAALQRALRAVRGLAEIQEELCRLLATKDAESRVRAIEGPLQKGRLVLDELERQQRALLDTLVGRRTELEALVEGVRDGGDPPTD